MLTNGFFECTPVFSAVMIFVVGSMALTLIFSVLMEWFPISQFNDFDISGIGLVVSGFQAEKQPSKSKAGFRSILFLYGVNKNLI